MICTLCELASAPVGRLVPMSPTFARWRLELVRGLALAERRPAVEGGGRILYSRRWRRDEQWLTYTHVLLERRFGLKRPPRGQLSLSLAESIASAFHDGEGNRGRR